VDGQFGAPSGTLPAMPPRLTFLSPGAPNPYQAAINNRIPISAPTGTSGSFLSGSGAPNTLQVTQAQIQQAGQNQYQTSERGVSPSNRSLLSPSLGSQSYKDPRKVYGAVVQTYSDKFDAAANQFATTGQVDYSTLPGTVSAQMQTQLGYTPQQMTDMGYTFSGTAWTNPKVPASAKIPAGGLQYGQYTDQYGNVQQGTTPFGINAAGQRLDIEGNVFDPATATRDIYGGKFIQVGEKRWERVGGKLRQVVYLGGGRKKVIKGQRNEGGGGTQAYVPPPVQYKPPVREESLPSGGGSTNVSFNTGVG
jgi:hypothetical protein